MNNLRRFWLQTEHGLGFGVTAASEEEAIQMACQAAAELGLELELQKVVVDVDVRTLDQDHIVPNMGPPNVRGVWFPRSDL